MLCVPEPLPAPDNIDQRAGRHATALHQVTDAEETFFVRQPLQMIQYEVVDVLGSTLIRRSDAVHRCNGGADIAEWDRLQNNKINPQELTGSAARHWKLGFAEWHLDEDSCGDIATWAADMASLPGVLFAFGKCGVIDGKCRMLAMFRKLNTASFPSSSLNLGGNVPTATFRIIPVSINLQVENSVGVIRSFITALESYETNMIMDTDRELSTELLFQVTRNLSEKQWAAVIGDAKILKQSRAPMGSFQANLLSAEQSLQKMRDGLRNSHSTSNHILLSALNPPFHIFKSADYENLDKLVGTRTDELTGEVIQTSYMEYLRNPLLHGRYACIIFGGNNTSGWGKSSLAESSAVAWSLDRCPNIILRTGAGELKLGVAERDIWSLSVMVQCSCQIGGVVGTN